MAAIILSTTVVTPMYPNSQVVYAKTKTYGTAQEFIDYVAPKARILAATNNLYASVMIAQAALESGYGKSKLSQAPYYNFYGVKAGKGYKGKTVSLETAEYDSNDSKYYIVDAFRAYNKPEESMKDYVKIFTASPWYKEYYKGVFKTNAKTYLDATASLTGTYATDIVYEQKLNEIIKQYDLTKYDIPLSQIKTTYKEKYYTVKNGESWTDISNEINDSVNNIKYWNGLKNNQTPKKGTKLKYLVAEYTIIGEEDAAEYLENEIIEEEFEPTVPLEQQVGLPTAEEMGIGVKEEEENKEVKKEETKKEKEPEKKETIEKHTEQKINTVKEVKEENKKEEKTTEKSIFIFENQKTEEEKIIDRAKKIITNAYTVNENETMYSIAKKVNMTTDEIKELNGLENSQVKVGQILIVKENQEVEKIYRHKVSEGDTLYAVAKKYKKSVEQLREWNELEGNELLVGSRVIVDKGNGDVQQEKEKKEVKIIEQEYQVKKDVKLKETPSFFSGKVTEIKNGQKITILSEKKEWSKIKYATYEGWLKNKNIKKIEVEKKAEKNIDNEKYDYYITKKGETLYNISTKFGMSVTEIKKMNNLETDTIIRAGQKIKIKKN